ncbi:heavy metal-associated isoprenylated plant protein 16 [Coffea arabica]|uniref:Heavy metal-associated isoprenylated plant protein 16 n=1 Tax=Coffea arabica TaxID=13443 RepID=A0A6P6SAN5_COFAR|nr:heavy metal-associated isoprenylated plant protein 16-like [Coffea arabica]
MKQKVVIRLSMSDEKSRKKAFKTVVGHAGVESTALQGKEKDQIEVVGDGIDAVKLATLLRKNVGYAELVTVSPVGEKKDGDKKDDGKTDPSSTEPPVVWSTYPYVYSSVPHHLYQARDPYYDSNCTIM